MNTKTVLVTAAVLLGCFILGEFLLIKYNGKPLPQDNIPRGSVTTGSGAPLKYAILGDSTAVGRGGDYQKGIAVSSAEFLARNHAVTYQNFAVTGARTSDVLNRQLPQALQFKPDVVLISVCANDVTHLTSLGAIKQNLEQTIDELRTSNPNVSIVLTGAAQMGSVPRFPQPIRYLSKLRTERVNKVVDKIVRGKHVVLAPIAAKTGAAFAKNPDLFAPDKFHPNTKGYNLWVPVIEQALSEATH